MNRSFGKYKAQSNTTIKTDQQEEHESCNHESCNKNIRCGDIDFEQFRYPAGFKPRDMDVIVGKGLNCYNHRGNITLRSIITSRLSDYAATTGYKEKTNIVTSIYEQIHKSEGAFIKKDLETGLWYTAEIYLARDKISQTFRNSLKQNKRKKSTKQRKRPRPDYSISVQNDGSNDFKTTLQTMKFQDGRNVQIPAGNQLKSLRRDSLSQIVSSNNLDSPSDEELSTFFEYYAGSIPDEVIQRDKNPFEPYPIRENDDSIT